MRTFLRFAAAFIALEALSAAGEDLKVIAELPGAIADSGLQQGFVLSLAKGGPKFLVNLATSSRSIRVWPVGRVSEPTISDLPDAVGINAIAAFADFDGDGFLDVAITGTNQIVFLKGDGAGRFTLAATLATSFQPWWLAAGDFDGDGRTDLVAVQSDQNPSAILSCFLSTGAFAFAPARTTVVTPGGGVSYITAGDLDGDARADLVIAPGMGSVSVWRGAGDGSFTLCDRQPRKPVPARADPRGPRRRRPSRDRFSFALPVPAVSNLDLQERRRRAFPSARQHRNELPGGLAVSLRRRRRRSARDRVQGAVGHGKPVRLDLEVRGRRRSPKAAGLCRTRT